MDTKSSPSMTACIFQPALSVAVTRSFACAARNRLYLLVTLAFELLIQDPG